MKKTIGIVGGIVLSFLAVSSTAQQSSPGADTLWNAKNNPTVDSLIAPYQGKMIPPRPAPTTADIFPVIGKYESSTNPEAASISIMLDEQNKGIVWIEGLSQGKVKAILKKSPATYKIPVQKTELGKDVAEGTLVFDKETNTLSICIGKTYNNEDPSAAFAAPAEEPATTAKASKVKKPVQPKAWIYTGTKLAKETAMQ